jgi:sugar/nucleoside kinase (ribokinase family)
LKGLIVSHGKDPVTFAWDGIIHHMPVESPKRFVASNGAGDALFSGVIHALLQDKPLLQAVVFGLKLARLTMEVASAINPEVAQYAREEERSVSV